MAGPLIKWHGESGISVASYNHLSRFDLVSPSMPHRRVRAHAHNEFIFLKYLFSRILFLK